MTMSAITPAPLMLPRDDRSSVRRWLVAGAAVVLVHAAIVYWLSRRVDPPGRAGEPEAAVMIELPPMSVAAPAPAAEVPPGPQMLEAAPQPEASEPEPPPPEPEIIEPQAAPVPELAPAPKPDAVLVAPAKPAPAAPPKPVVKPKLEVRPKPEAKPKPERRQPIEKEATKAPAKEAGPRARASAPPRQNAGAPGQSGAQAARGSAGSSMSAAAWQGLVSAQVNRNTRYPPSAQGATGAATVSFSVDRSGRLVGAGLARSSGSAALDAEAVATVRRSGPFPPPPPELPGGRFNFAKTINFRH